ncbi:Ca2+-transporting ATPase [Leptospira meyeri]|uniref:Ca2+-transporting ATPase n=2 Tax=Leptospira TaxID=171 RepID=A0A4V3HHS4_LEPME|nr:MULTISPECIES: cation-translocating P-type ATPase [Leptospira]EKJ86019.1 E1-E2 ATPase [Leptospira meyeri serovar Hardjo str. Went 5]TDY66774.1 Ca2+-transporting ATPase [Leptospira meyeri]GBF44418.1 E1-E2 ATPase [Leptospira ellinghausenii]
MEWYANTVESILVELRCTLQGLTRDEVIERQKEFGKNTLKEGKKVSGFQIFISQFTSLIIWILIGSAFLSGFLGEYIDSIVIISIVVLNGILGFYQEYNAEKSMEALKKMTTPHAKVLRDGDIKSIPNLEVVPGDIIELESGDIIPADARIISSSELKTNEAPLTGESVAVSKNNHSLSGTGLSIGERKNMLHLGTTIVTGTARAIVVATGMKSEIGNIAQMLDENIEEETPLQLKIKEFGKFLLLFCLGVVFLLFIIGVLRQIPLITLILTSVSLAVAAIPEGLPAIITVALSLGVVRMSKKNALVRKLSSVETLGSASVICTDKTGTLTVGQMTVKSIFTNSEVFQITGSGYNPEGEITDLEGQIKSKDRIPEILGSCMILCNNSHLSNENGEWISIGDPTETALLTLATKLGFNFEACNKEWERVSEIPFDSDRKMQSVICINSNQVNHSFVKGAPDIILKRCKDIQTDQGIFPLTSEIRSKIESQSKEFANQSLRLLGFAYKAIDSVTNGNQDTLPEDDLVFLGLTGMIDPPRAEVKEAIRKCNRAGIKVVMITGDHPDTAFAIAKDLNIASDKKQVLTPSELDTMDEKALEKSVREICVYARVSAKHKSRIVKAWKSQNVIVAMTGDGVNDAPAIKAANIGIAMGKNGTEVTKQASDLILNDDNFATIVNAIEEGRGIYNNIRKTLQYLLSGNIAELLVMLFCILIGLPIPLLPVHLLWINLVTDGLPALFLASDPIDTDVMEAQPKSSTENLINKDFITNMCLTGVLTSLTTLGVYLYGLEYESEEIARTHAFAVLVFIELFRSLSIRSEKPIWRTNLFGNMKLLILILITASVQIFGHHSEFFRSILKTSILDWVDCFMLLGVSIVPIFILEMYKVAISKIKSDNKVFS